MNERHSTSFTVNAKNNYERGSAHLHVRIHRFCKEMQTRFKSGNDSRLTYCKKDILKTHTYTLTQQNKNAQNRTEYTSISKSYHAHDATRYGQLKPWRWLHMLVVIDRWHHDSAPGRCCQQMRPNLQEPFLFESAPTGLSTQRQHTQKSITGGYTYWHRKIGSDNLSAIKFWCQIFWTLLQACWSTRKGNNNRQSHHVHTIGRKRTFPQGFRYLQIAIAC